MTIANLKKKLAIYSKSGMIINVKSKQKQKRERGKKMKRTEFYSKERAMQYIRENGIKEATVYTDQTTGRTVVEAIVKA